ncbi:hypothetical protein Apa02nite_020440 [Actinoplanes palleronii]|uniref:Uncharacterized protein n=1 Tax=Actinoplanes palleronii TaxID=113570 RepID=A0ABQ4B662_9ACTN|nr:hypothetical protein Apa02nite_020440 [Actinoplanes palleronii]
MATSRQALWMMAQKRDIADCAGGRGFISPPRACRDSEEPEMFVRHRQVLPAAVVLFALSACAAPVSSAPERLLPRRRLTLPG